MQIVVAEHHEAPTARADIVLLAGRGAFLPASGSLLVSDLHLGKAATFRRAGIPVPEGSAQADLDRLERLVRGTAARRLLVLGDLFHARTGCTERVFAEFTALRRRIAGTEVVLVLGNHDRSVGAMPAQLGIDACVPHLTEAAWHFVHEPPPAPAGLTSFTIAGHLHPTVSIRSPAGDRVADRCFVADGPLLVLPAFGSFTGGHRVAPAPGLQLWLARDDGVVDVSRLAAAAARPRR